MRPVWKASRDQPNGNPSLEKALASISDLGVPFGLNYLQLSPERMEVSPHSVKNLLPASRNHRHIARQHAWESARAQKKDTFAERLYHLRAHTGLTKEAIRKIRLEEEPIDPHRLAHYSALCQLAVAAADATGFELADVDGKYDPVWPSKSDFSLFKQAGPDHKSLIILVDIHSGPYQPLKLAALVAQAETGLALTDSLIVVATLRVAMDEGPWVPELMPRISLKENLHYSLAVPAAIGEIVLASSSSQNQALVESLDMTIGEEVRQVIQEEYNKALEDDKLREQSRVLFQHLDTHLGLKREHLLELCRYRDPNIYQASRELLEVCKDLGLDSLSAMLELPGSGLWLDPDQCEMRSAPPVPVADLDERRNLVSQILTHDPLMLGIHRILNLDGDERKKSASGVAITLKGDVMPIPPGEEPQFDQRQTLKTRFHPNVLAYVRRPRSLRTQYRRRIDNVTLTRNEMPESDFKMESRLFNSIYEVQELYVYAPNVQVLINHALYNEPRLTKFLNRGGADSGLPATRSKEEDRFNILEENEKRFRDYVESCVPDFDAACQMRLSRGSASGKMALLLSRVASASVRDVFSMTRGLVESYLLSYYDYESQKARSMAISMSGRTPENLMTLLEVPSYAAVVLSYVNNEALHFRTTWCKELVLTSAPDSLLTYCDLGRVFDPATRDYNGMSQQVDSIKVNVRPGQLGFSTHRELRIVSSKFHSRNRADLDWAIERPYKCLVRAESLIEMRGLLYSEGNSPFSWGDHSTYEGVEFARRELIVNLSGFGEQSQQNSISQTAQRYLHQSLGSLDNDPMATLRKLEGIRLRGCSRVASHGMMALIYSLSSILRFSHGPEFLTSGNGEVAVLMPDLMRASSLAQLNVSCYATPNQMLVDKPNATPSEALDVQGVWDNNAKVRKINQKHPNLRHGISEDLARSLLSSHRSGEISNAMDLAAWILDNSQLVCQNVREIALLPRGTQLVSCVFFETLAHLRLRLEVGTMDSISVLSGQSLSDFFTTRGSFRSKDYEAKPGSVHSVESLRKAAAVVRVVADMQGLKDPSTQRALLARSLKNSPDALVDLYQVVSAVEIGRLESTPLGKGSDKDAPGKNREITTLEAVYGLECVALERMHMALSHATPEDQILKKDKEAALSTKLNRAQLGKRTEDKTRTYYINRDMSAHGPTHKSCSSAVTVALLAADQRSLNFGIKIVEQSSKKKWLYPDNIVDQALQLERAYDPTSHTSVWSSPESLDPTRNSGPTKTGTVLRRIREQYERGSEDGPPGSTWAEVADGMPGQGIFSIQASVSHSAVARLAKRELGEKLTWGLDTVINSDDSMVILTVPDDKTEDVRRALRPVLSRFIMFAGLCENEGKFTPTIKRPEFVSLFHSGSEPVTQTFKFTNALTALDAGANLAEDLHRASTRGSDVMKHGTSFLIASVVSSACMALVLDAHRAWGLYGDALQSGSVPGEVSLMDLLPEEMGLPRIDPAASVLSSLGSRLASFANLIPEGPMDDLYVRYLVGSLFSTPETLSESLATDLRAGVERPSHTRLVNADGSLDAVIPRRLQIPNINGLRGTIRRPKGTLRLARQLGPEISLLRSLSPDYKGRLQLAGLLSSAMRGLRNPLEKGEENPSPIVQINDLNHSASFRNLTVGARSAIRPLVDRARVSQQELFTILKRKEAPKQIREAFLEVLRGREEIPALLRPLFESLISQAKEVLALARDLKVAHLEPNFNAIGLLEHEYGHYKARKVVKRTFDVRAGKTVALNRDEAFRVFLLESLKPEDVNLLPLELVRLLDSEKPRGEEPLMDALEQAEVMADRLMGSLPHSYKVTAFVSAFAREGERMVEEWVRHNVVFGHRAIWPNGDVRSRSLASVINLPRSIAEVDNVTASVNSFINLEFKLALEGRHASENRPIGVRTEVAKSLSDFVVGGPPGKLSRSFTRTALKANPDLLASSFVSLNLSKEDASLHLVAASRRGWVPRGGKAHRIFGPVAWWGSQRTQRSQAFLAQTRSWDVHGTTWSHVLVWTGDSPRSLRDVSWMSSEGRDYLERIKDGLVLGRAGFSNIARSLETASPKTSSGHPLRIRDEFSHKVITAQDDFEVCRCGLQVALRLISATVEVVISLGFGGIPQIPTQLNPKIAPSRSKLTSTTLNLGAGARKFTSSGQPHVFAGEDAKRAVDRLCDQARSPAASAMVIELQSVSSHLVESIGERNGPELGGINLPSIESLKTVEASLVERDWDLIVESVVQMSQNLVYTYEQRRELARLIVRDQADSSNPKAYFGALLFVGLDRLGLADPASARASISIAISKKNARPMPLHAPHPEPENDWTDETENQFKWEAAQQAFELSVNLEEAHRVEQLETARVRTRGRVFDLMNKSFQELVQQRVEAKRNSAALPSTGDFLGSSKSESQAQDLAEEEDNDFLRLVWAEWHASRPGSKSASNVEVD